ncbi:hypothetical protein MKZ38_007844 [Zalerion maritima]|uniref:Uncharacterized protein n=1 Tax=Zalerion maritima TaxID=339359 RepID=A0AAD5S2R9_9PEZI|nr:hypothetical protein MKZ38_007844 [Zalerion maritima]
MTTSNNAQINELAEVSQAFIPQAAEAPLTNFLSLVPSLSAPYTPKNEQPLPERRLSNFLTLAPTTSESFPQNPRSRHQSISHLTRPLPLTHGPLPADPAAVVSPPRSMSSSLISLSEATPKSRRSSSMSSDSSSSKGRLRFLKLGPVHWGEHQGDHKEDWHEIDEEVISP